MARKRNRKTLAKSSSSGSSKTGSKSRVRSKVRTKGRAGTPRRGSGHGRVRYAGGKGTKQVKRR